MLAISVGCIDSLCRLCMLSAIPGIDGKVTSTYSSCKIGCRVCLSVGKLSVQIIPLREFSRDTEAEDWMIPVASFMVL